MIQVRLTRVRQNVCFNHQIVKFIGKKVHKFTDANCLMKVLIFLLEGKHRAEIKNSWLHCAWTPCAQID